MNLKEIIGIINGTLLYDSEEISGREYSYAIASDLMSNVMLETVDDSILITSLVNTQVIRASEMMKITCIIITCGKTTNEQEHCACRNGLYDFYCVREAAQPGFDRRSCNI